MKGVLLNPNSSPITIEYDIRDDKIFCEYGQTFDIVKLYELECGIQRWIFESVVHDLKLFVLFMEKPKGDYNKKAASLMEHFKGEHSLKCYGPCVLLSNYVDFDVSMYDDILRMLKRGGD